MSRLLWILGAFFLLIGIVGFLFAAVGLVAASEGPRVQSPPENDDATVTVELPADDPVVLRRRKMAETVLAVGLVFGGTGVVFLIAGFVATRREKQGGRRPVRDFAVSGNKEIGAGDGEEDADNGEKHTRKGSEAG